MDAASDQGGRRAESPAWLARLAVGARVSTAPGLGYGRLLLALVMIALGVRGLAFGDFAGVWQRIPIAHLPAHDAFVHIVALVELATGIGILVPRIAKISAAVMVMSLTGLLVSKPPGIGIFGFSVTGVDIILSKMQTAARAGSIPI